MTQDSYVQKTKNFIHLLQSIYANIRYGFPSKKLKVIGVTGTDGKTTTTLMLYHVLKSLGHKTGYISTNGAMIGDKSLDTGLHVTTPDPWMVPKYLKMMVNEGVQDVVLESTSSGLQQNRLWGVEFDYSIITNIKSDHLDYHGNWENYANAKFKIIKQLKSDGVVVLNKEDEKSYKWLNEKIKKLNTKINTETIAQRDAHNVNYSLKGLKFSYLDQEFEVGLIGDYNLENTLGVVKLLSNFLDLADIAKSLKDFKPPKGRMEVVSDDEINVIIDFAHTPSSLQRALFAINELKTKDQRLIVVFGCAGKRDKERRKMGEISARLGDIVILTAEDPRDERLKDINDEIYQNAQKAGGVMISRIKDHKAYKNTKLSVVKTLIDLNLDKKQTPIIAFDQDSPASREDAIDMAIRLARKNDIVFSTGKAHEESLAFGVEEKEYPWNEHNAVRESLSRK